MWIPREGVQNVLKVIFETFFLLEMLVIFVWRYSDKPDKLFFAGRFFKVNFKGALLVIFRPSASFARLLEGKWLF